MQTFEDAAKALKAKMRQHPNFREITEEEYAELKRKQNQILYQSEEEQAKQRRLESLEKIGLHPDDLSLTWSAVRGGVSDGMKAMQPVKEAYERGWGMIFLWGTYGQAKTLVGKILVATAFNDGKSTAYANVSSVLDDVRLAFDEPEHKTTELLRRMEYWQSRDVLFLDELDKSNDTPWAQERMFQLLDHRYASAIREQNLTVLASNKSHDALDGYLKSRLSDSRLGPVVHLNGTDGRQVMPGGWKF